MLSLWDSLRSSTQEGRIVPGWPMHLRETLLLWKSKDRKCCLYKTPYVAAPTGVLGVVIAKFSTLHATSYRARIIFGSRVMRFWRDPSRHFETPTWNFSQVVYKQKLYWKGLLIALFEDSCKEYLQASLQADSTLTHCHEQNASGTLKIKMTAKKERWAISPDSCASNQLHF